jgi:hypothetical protein
MTVKARLTGSDLRLHRPRLTGRRNHSPGRRSESAAAVTHAEVRGFHEGGPPLDQALYTCQCGCAFEASVSTSVDCPHCGTAQAW